MQLSLFYFADAATEKKPTGNTYQLLMDGARYADAHGFAAVWIPERHFHPIPIYKLNLRHPLFMRIRPIRLKPQPM